MFRSGTSPKSDSAVGLTHCSNTWRTVRRSSIRRMCPSQFQRWSLARRAMSIEGSRASSAIGLPDILESILDPVAFNLRRTLQIDIVTFESPPQFHVAMRMGMEYPKVSRVPSLPPARPFRVAPLAATEGVLCNAQLRPLQDCPR